MASNENQKALDNLYDYAEMGCSTWDSKKDNNESINKSKQALQQVIKSKQALQQVIDDLEVYKKALKNACSLAIQNNHSGSYFAIHEGTREQYNLPLTLDDMFNRKILNDYLLEQARGG